MKYDATTIYQLTRKLEKEGDISLKEADGIFSLFSENLLNTKLNINSSKFDAGLVSNLGRWFQVVAEKIRKGERGNFIFTVYLKSVKCTDFSYPARRALSKWGNFEDLCSIIMVDEKIYSKFPLKHLFSENECSPGRYYTMRTSRAGMLYYPFTTNLGTYTISQLMDKPTPFTLIKPRTWGAYMFAEKFFEIASGAQEITQDLWNFNDREISCFIMSDFIRHNSISCAAAVDLHSISCAAAADLHNGKPILLVEKEKVPFVKKAWDISLEELIRNALTQNIINKKEAQSLLGGKPEYDFPIVEFTKASTQYLNEMVKRKMEWKSTREKVENEDTWFEEIR